MKRLAILILIVAFAVVGWAMPAGAEKIRLTDDQMDNVAAASQPTGHTWVKLGDGGCFSGPFGEFCGGGGLKVQTGSSKLVHLGGGGEGCIDMLCGGGGVGLSIFPGGGSPSKIVVLQVH